MAETSPIVCRMFLRGACAFGDGCRFFHPGAQLLDAYLIPRRASNAEAAYQSHGMDSSDYRGSNTSLNSHGRAKATLTWKTTPCWHFIRNGGFCPLGETCKFIHDKEIAMERIEYAALLLGGNDPIAVNDPNRISEALKPHCWTCVQRACQAPDCPYFHPRNVRPYMKYTPCPAWLDCSQPTSCPYRHAEQALATSLPPDYQDTTGSGPCSPRARSTLILNGTTYYNVSRQLPLIPSSYSMASNDQLNAEPMSGAAANPPGITQNPAAARTEQSPMAPGNEEFPYRPPANQRSGHARRISIKIK